MKAKSKVLLGLIVALAMMVFAVPAFAQGTATHSVGAPNPATQEAFIGDDVSFTFNITDTALTAANTYTVEITDTVTSATGTAIINEHINKTFGTATTDSISVTVTIPKDKVDASQAGSVHSMAIKVTKNNIDITGETPA